MKFIVRVFISLLLFIGVTGIVALSRAAQHQAQDSPTLLLPNPEHVRGQVVGEDGQPIAKVRLYHVKQPEDIVTDSNGQFDFMTSAPSFVAQRPGFQSVIVHTRNTPEFRIVLRKSVHADFPVCSKVDLSGRAPGWSGAFQLPRSRSLRTSREVLDVDYWSRKLRLKSKSPVVQAVQGRGPMWGGGDPEDELVWRSKEYNEVTYDLAGRLLTDARGSLLNGKCWREVGVFGESVGYSDVDCKLAKPLDDLLDGTCIIPNASEHLFP